MKKNIIIVEGELSNNGVFYSIPVNTSTKRLGFDRFLNEIGIEGSRDGVGQWWDLPDKKLTTIITYKGNLHGVTIDLYYNMYI